MNIEFTTTPNSVDINFLTHKLNEETKEIGSASSFAFFMRDEEGKIIAGCNGSVIFGCIYTDQLWVDQKCRKQGLGKQLMETVHDYGKKNGCAMATVCTMSFQAQGFYEKLGYIINFERHGYTQNSSCLFLQKKL